MSSEKGRRFSHLRWKDRLKIERMLKEGHKVKEIAAALHVDSTTIYREIKRGKTVQRTTELIDREIYCPDVAENKYRANLAAKGPALKLATTTNWRHKSSRRSWRNGIRRRRSC